MQERPWLATYRDFGIPAQIEPARHVSVTVMMEEAMRRFAGKTAFRSLGLRLSYAEVDRLSRNFAAWLQSQGVKPGERVAVMTPNVLAFPVAMLGILRAGAVQVNVNPLYTPRELAHQLTDADAQTLVVFDGATPTFAEVAADTPVRRVITASLDLEGDSKLPGPPVDARLAHALSFSQVLAAGQSLPLSPVNATADDLIFLQYTGGTTGLSKGAALSHGNLLANCAQFALFMPEARAEAEEVVVTAIPLYHIFALMVNFISYFSIGAENWLVANPRDMDAFVETLRQASPTVITGVNTLYAGLTLHPKLPGVDWSRLKLAAGGGSQIVPTVSQRWKALTGQMIREGYGLSETSPIVSFNPGAVGEFTATTGLPLPSTDVKLLDEHDGEVAVAQAGEVCVKGPQVMRGYWQQPEANAEAFTADGYFRTGDVGVFDARGFLRIVDRKKDLIIVSGFNVYPNEIEAVASACEGVAECACIGLPDDRTGESVKLFVVPSAGHALTEEQILAHCRSQLTAYKMPKAVRIVQALPKSTVGKILRRELRSV